MESANSTAPSDRDPPQQRLSSSQLRLAEDDEARKDFLRSRAVEGFASSAYWGATGDVPPREPDDQTPKEPYRFQREINRKLVPFPKEQTSIPRTLDYTVVGLHLMTDDGNSNTGGLNAAQLAKLHDSDAQLEATETGLSVKPRFLNMKTTTQRMPGAFDDDVMRALRDGERKLDEDLRKLEELKRTPFATTDPNGFRLTSDDYCDMSGIDPTAYRVTQRDPTAAPGEGVDVEVYKSRYNNVEREGPKRRAGTMEMMQRERQVDPRALRAELEHSHRSTLPKGYAPYSAKEWLSTTHRDHADYDVDAAAAANERLATEPLRNTNYQLTAAHELALSQREERQRGRYDGDWATEYSDHYQDRAAQADVTKDFAHRSVFDIRNGIYTMDHHFHHPRDDTTTGETYSPSELVPGQYATMSQKPLHARNLVGTTQR